MKFIAEYICIHQTYINIQSVVQRVNIKTVKISLLRFIITDN